MYVENYKILSKEVREDLNKAISHVDELESLILLRWPHSPNQIDVQIQHNPY